MKNIIKAIAIMILAIIGLNIAFHVLGTVLTFAFKVGVSLLILSGVAYLIMNLLGGPRSLTGGRRGTLP